MERSPEHALTTSRKHLELVESRGECGMYSDVELMSRLRGGDLQALGRLFLRHHARTHELCFRLSGERQLADDLVQETFLRVLRYRDSFKGKSAFSTWLYRIARNVCLDHFASLNRRESAQFRGLEMLSEETESSIDYEDERLNFLNDALMGLSIEKREVLVLSRYHELSYAEIAKVCNCSISAVKVRVPSCAATVTGFVFRIRSRR